MSEKSASSETGKTYRCHYTGKLVSEEEVEWVPGVLPGSGVKHPCAPGWKPYRRTNYICFADSEQNCNTCKHLVRVKHEKNRQGFLFGKCAAKPIEVIAELWDGETRTYKPQVLFPSYTTIEGVEGEVMRFHPDDPMFMSCYESRFDWTEENDRCLAEMVVERLTDEDRKD